MYFSDFIKKIIKFAVHFYTKVLISFANSGSPNQISVPRFEFNLEEIFNFLESVDLDRIVKPTWWRIYLMITALDSIF